MKTIASLVLALAASTAWAEPIEHQITVKGEGKSRVAPDFVSIEVGVASEGQDTARIKQDVDEKTQRLLEAAARFQIPAADVKSSGMQVNRNYETDRNDNEIFKGFVVGRTLEIRLRKIDDYEALAQELVAAGMEEVESIQVGVDDESRLRVPALAAAAKDARVKALAVAESLGIRIGLPIEVGEDRLWYDENLVQIAPRGGLGEIVVTGSRGRKQDLLNFTPRDVEVEAEVWVRFAIEPARPQ
jgi:uncharacterized protein YggE